jgi:hypothetical protein
MNRSTFPLVFGRYESWAAAYKAAELSDYSVCTAWACALFAALLALVRSDSLADAAVWSKPVSRQKKFPVMQGKYREINNSSNKFKIWPPKNPVLAGTYS